MIIIGAGGHASEILDILSENQKNNCYLYDDFTKDIAPFLNKVPVCTNMEHASQLLKKNPEFVIGIGNVKFRKKLSDMFLAAGGELTSTISNLAFCSKQQTTIGIGVNIMAYAFVSAGVSIGEGSLINARAHLHHKVIIGDYCEVSPGAILLGNVKLGNFVQIGAGAILLPGIVIANYAIIGAGAVVTKNVEEGITVVGNPAKKI